MTSTEAKALEDYSADRLLRQAIERSFEITGEAVGRLIRDDPDTAFECSERRRIVSFRNVLIHGYDLVDDELVRDPTKTELPVLLSEVEGLPRRRTVKAGLLGPGSGKPCGQTS